MKRKIMEILVVINFFGSLLAGVIAFVAVHKAWMKLVDEPESTIFNLL